MVQKTNALAEIRRAASERFWDALITSVFFAWGYLLLLNATPFAYVSHNIYLPVIFFIALITLLGSCFLITAQRMPDHSWTHCRSWAYCCAAAASFLFGIVIAFPAPAVAILPVIILLTGIALFLFSTDCFSRYRKGTVLEALVESALTFASSVAILIVSTTLMSGANLMYCYAAMLLVCGLGMRHPVGLPTDDESALPRQPAAQKLPSPPNSEEHRLPGWRLFNTVLFLDGVLLAYEFNGTQKTMHFVGVYVFPGQIGGTAFISLEYLLLTMVLLIVSAFAYIKSSVVPIGIAAVIVVAASFLSIPNLETLPFPLLATIATALLYIVCIVFSSVSKDANSESEALALFCSNMALLSFGGAAGSLLAFFVLAFLDSESQSIFFASFQTILLLAIIIAFIVLHKDVSVLVGKRHHRTVLDLSKLEDRCTVLAEQCGLTKREAEILDLLACGRSAPSIAAELSIAKSTVKSHIIQIYRKTGVSSRQQLLDKIYGKEGAF